MEEEQRHHQAQQHHHYGGGGSSANTPAISDLRQFFSPIPTHHQFPPPQSLFSPPTAAAFPHHYDTMMLVAAHGIHDFRSDNSAAVTTALAPASSVAGASAGGFDMDNAAGGGGGGSGGFGLGVGGGDGGATARWPRQETLTLLEIRSRLDHKFKEANHKGPLWDEVSRIMSAEHGYERSGKKCREKFENLYKYYKKTKEGKAGRQDGKHYRFFRQLEALYGEATHHPNPISIHTHHLNMINHHNANSTTTAAAATAQFHSTSGHQEGNFQSISLSHTSSDCDTSSSEGNDVDIIGSTEIKGYSSMDMAGRSRKRRGSGKRWKANIKEFIDLQMRRIMEKQEAWLEKMMRSLESKEKERMTREEDWRKKEAMRMEREHRFWAKERAWIEARDKALLDALQRITGKEVGNVVENDNPSQHGQQVEEEEEEGNNEDVGDDRWEESEIIKLVELRSSIQARFDERGGGLEEKDLWEEISTRMGCLGHDRSPKMCKDKWNFISKELSNKRKSHQYQHNHHPQTTNLLYNYGHHEMNEQGGMGFDPPQLGLTRGGGGGGGARNPMNDSCLRILLGDGGETHPWESYGVKLSKGDHAH